MEKFLRMIMLAFLGGAAGILGGFLLTFLFFGLGTLAINMFGSQHPYTNGFMPIEALSTMAMGLGAIMGAIFGAIFAFRNKK